MGVLIVSLQNRIDCDFMVTYSRGLGTRMKR
jgi:hypothetical protein